MLSTVMRSLRRFWLWDLLGLCLLAVVATFPFRGTSLDIVAGGLFYRPDQPSPWFLENRFPWRFLYDYGTWPALVVGLASTGGLLASVFKPSLIRWRRHLLFLILSLAIGPGLLVNVIFKDHWGRPRPRQIEQFGGHWHHQDVLDKGVSGRGKAFPCGHSSMGYYFVVFYFLLRRKRRLAAFMSLACAGLYGSLLGAARMAAGAHFLSDVLWSAVFTAGAAFLLYYLILRVPQHEDAVELSEKPSPHPFPLLGLALLLGIGALSAGLAATPSYSEIRYSFPVARDRPLALSLNATRCDITVRITNATAKTVGISGEIQAFGWPWSKIREQAAITNDGPIPRLDFSAGNEGHFTEFSGRVVVSLPSAATTAILAQVDHGDILLTSPEGIQLPACRFRIKNGDFVKPDALQSAFTEVRDGDWVEYRSKATTP